MERKSRTKLFLLVCFFSFYISLFAAEPLLENPVHVVSGTVIHGFERMYFSTNPDVADRNSQKKADIYIYVQANTIFTAPDCVLQQVVYTKHTPIVKVKKSVNTIASNKEKKIISRSKTICKQTSPHPFNGLPIKDSEHFNRGLINHTISSLNKISFNSVVVSQTRNNFIFLLDQGRKGFFCQFKQLHSSSYFDNHTTRPPPFLD